MARGKLPKLTAEEVQYIQRVCARRRQSRLQFLKVEELAEQFNVSHMTIRRALELDPVEVEARRNKEKERSERRSVSNG